MIDLLKTWLITFLIYLILSKESVDLGERGNLEKNGDCHSEIAHITI